MQEAKDEQPRTYCVIGVSGLVGSHVAATLLDAGHHVRGTMRDPKATRSRWVREALGGRRGELTLHAADLREPDSLRLAMEGAQGVVMSAGTEAQQPETVELMVGAADHTLAAARSLGIGAVVFTSSTGSTNPPGGEPEIKREGEHWSDPDAQEAAGKYSPAAKTRMERTALRLMDESDGALRVAILNPSLITGPAFSTDPPGYLEFIRAILTGQRFADGAPDGSMSMIDVRDLARLHVAALRTPEARGRYFGVVQSWHWQDILQALARVAPGYDAPRWPEDRPRTRPTQFDFTRRDSLGVELRGLDEMLEATVAELRRRDLWP